MAAQSGVYEIVNTVNGKRYIGGTVDFHRRWGLHCRQLRAGKHHSQKLQRAWNKYGEATFKFLPILTCQPSMLLFYEQQLLDKVKPEYNIALDAQAPTRGRPRSAETKAKLSAKATAQMAVPGVREALSKANKGRKRTAAQIAATAAGNRGKTISDAHKAAISASRMGNTSSRGRKMSEQQRAGLIGNVHAAGHTHSDAWRKYMSERMMGRTFSEEQRANISASAKARGISPETRAKMAAAKRKKREARHDA